MTLLGVVNQETWSFFNEIYADLQKHYQVSVFEHKTWRSPIFHERINRHLFHQTLTKFLEKNDVVFFEWASDLLVAATRLPKVCGIVTRLHRYEMYQWVDKINWDGVDKIIVVSEAKRREFIGRFPNQAEKTVVIPPSTSLEKFSLRPKTFKGNIGILGNLTPRKRVYELILAFYELKQKRSGLHLHIGGGMRAAYQDYYHALHHIVKELDLQDSVTFYGNVTNTCDWFHNIDIYVSNSYSEGLQVSPMEAMASGCYCLAHRWDGANELLPEEYLFSTNDDLMRMIEQYCELSEDEKLVERQYMRSIARKNFDINRTIEKINHVINEVASCAELAYGKK